MFLGDASVHDFGLYRLMIEVIESTLSGDSNLKVITVEKILISSLGIDIQLLELYSQYGPFQAIGR
jgi:hypothetical protein